MVWRWSPVDRIGCVAVIAIVMGIGGLHLLVLRRILLVVWRWDPVGGIIWRRSSVDGIGCVAIVAIIATVRSRHDCSWDDESSWIGVFGRTWFSLEQRETLSICKVAAKRERERI